MRAQAMFCWLSCCVAWQPAPSPLMTRFAADVTPQQEPEYPRPMMQRAASSWQSLNGLWQLDLNVSDLSAPPFGQQLPQEILVPYPVESPLSGLRMLPPKFYMWYRRLFQISNCDGEITLLHFEAVDFNTTVYVDGVLVGNHVGGYDEFSFDITKALAQGKQQHELIVGVFDPTTGVKGKQSRDAMSNPSGITYTSSSGIWSTVWLECLPKSRIDAVVPVPLEDLTGFTVEVQVVSQTKSVAHVTIVNSAGETIATASAPVNGSAAVLLHVIIPPSERFLWSPASPYLYNFTVTLTDGATASSTTLDTVNSYGGLRWYTVALDAKGIVRPLLNGKPIYQMATLDQGFWPDGNYAAPTDAALKYDVQALKALGFNAVRKHQKVEPRRWYHHCDVLGLLVWQDIPCCADGTFMSQVRAIVGKRRMHPSIVQWDTFNEGGGMGTVQFVAGVVDLVRELDPTRPVDAASGGRDLCHDPPVKWQGGCMFGNFTDRHHYPEPSSPGEPSGGATFAIAAAGGPNASATHHVDKMSGVFVRHCNSLGYAHSLNPAKSSDAAFVLVPALNSNGSVSSSSSSSGSQNVSFKSANNPSCYLGVRASDGRLVLMGEGKPTPLDAAAASFQMDVVKNKIVGEAVVTLRSLARGGMHGQALTQFFQAPACVACVCAKGSNNCTGDYVGVRPVASSSAGAGAGAGVGDSDPLAEWQLLPLAPPQPPVRSGTAKVNGEYGGLLLLPESMTPPQKEWAPGRCHGYGSAITNQTALSERYAQFADMIVSLREEAGLSASVYTQTTDCETECNGLLTYDRIMKPDVEVIRAANEKLTLE